MKFLLRICTYKLFPEKVRSRIILKFYCALRCALFEGNTGVSKFPYTMSCHMLNGLVSANRRNISVETSLTIILIQRNSRRHIFLKNVGKQATKASYLSIIIQMSDGDKYYLIIKEYVFNTIYICK